MMGWFWYTFCQWFGHDIIKDIPPRDGLAGWAYCRRCQRKLTTVPSTATATLDEMMANPMMPRPLATAPESVDILLGHVHMAAISIGQVCGGMVYLRDRTDTQLVRHNDDEDMPTVWWPMPSTFNDIDNLEQDEH